MDKADFREYKALALEVLQIKDQLDALCDPKGPRYSADPRGGSVPGSDAMVSVMTARMELEAQYRSALAEKEVQQLRVEQAIQSLTDAGERLVMRALYIEGKRWPVVIREMERLGYSERTAYRLHGSALWKLKEF